MKTKPITFRQMKILSCYLDGQLNLRQAAKLEKRLAQDSTLREKMLQMRQMRHLVCQLKPKVTQRNFMLKPEMVAAFRKLSPASRWLPALSYSTLAVAVMMVGAIVGQFIPMAKMASETPVEMAVRAPIMELEDAAVSSEAEFPLQLISWGNATATTYDAYTRGGVGGLGEGKGGGGAGLTTNADIALIGPPAQVTNSSGVTGFTLIIPRADTAAESKQPPDAIRSAQLGSFTVFDSGPILGLRISNEAEVPRAEEPVPMKSTQQFPWLVVGLGGLTLLLGGATFILWLKTRSA